MIRVDSDAVHLPARCIEQSVPAPGGEDDEAATSTTSSSSGGGCFPLLRRRQRPRRALSAPIGGGDASLPTAQVIGAEVDPRGRVRVWYTEPEAQEQQQKQLRGYVCPPPLRVRVSAPVDVGGGGASAESVVASVRALNRRGSSSGLGQTPTRVVAIVNPVSGRGRALRDFEREARPLLERAAGFAVTVLPTRRAGHAFELARGLELPAQGGGGGLVLAVVGGDGTLHEVINGLLSRPDWRRVCGGGGGGAEQQPLLLAHVPCGSGNGVAVSCGLRDAATAAAAIAKGSRAPLDVTSVLVRTRGGRPPTMAQSGGGANDDGYDASASRLTRTFCALSVVYGMMANLDVRTEPLRFLGDARFTLGGALEILGARSYACRGAWVGPAAAAASAAGGFLGEEDVGGEEDGDEGGRQGGEEEEGVGGYRPPPADGALLAGARARSCDRLAAASDADAAADPLGDGGPPLPLLARLMRDSGGRLPECVPDSAGLRASGWRALPVRSGNGDGRGVHMFAAVSPPYVAGNYRFNPLGGLSTGALRQMWVPGHSVKGLAGRLRSLALQDAAAEGTHLDAGRGAGLMRHAPAAALALEPLAPAGETWVQLDGEVVRGAVPGAAIWAEVHEGLLGVVVRPGHYESEAGRR